MAMQKMIIICSNKNCPMSGDGGGVFFLIKSIESIKMAVMPILYNLDNLDGFHTLHNYRNIAFE